MKVYSTRSGCVTLPLQSMISPSSRVVWRWMSVVAKVSSTPKALRSLLRTERSWKRPFATSREGSRLYTMYGCSMIRFNNGTGSHCSVSFYTRPCWRSSKLKEKPGLWRDKNGHKEWSQIIFLDGMSSQNQTQISDTKLDAVGRTSCWCLRLAFEPYNEYRGLGYQVCAMAPSV